MFFAAFCLEKMLVLTLFLRQMLRLFIYFYRNNFNFLLVYFLESSLVDRKALHNCKF